jgi:Rap1a immunity proteins
MVARLWMIMMSAALAAAITLAQAQNSEFDALPKPAAPPPAPAVTEKPAAALPKSPSAAEIAAEKKAATEKLAAEKKAAADKALAEKKAAGEKAALEKAAEKEKAEKKAAALPADKEPPAAKKQGSALGAKQDSKDEGDIQLGRRMAPSAAIPPFPGDEKGPKTIEFLGSCASQYDRCMDQVREIGEKISASELCIPPDLYFATVTDRVRKWATLRPDIHGQPAGRVIAAALRSIYPCKRAAPATVPARTAAEKGGKAAKEAQ